MDCVKCGVWTTKGIILNGIKSNYTVCRKCLDGILTHITTTNKNKHKQERLQNKLDKMLEKYVTAIN